jgi:hypothetical protein
MMIGLTCGAMVLGLGLASNTAWAPASTKWVAHLLEERR